MSADNELPKRLDEIARSPSLLVASDFDGTLAPIVDSPAAAEANREAIVALKALSQMPQTHVAIISGRSLSDLAARTGEVEDAHLVGSHGSEFEAGFALPVAAEARDLHLRLKEVLAKVAQTAPGLSLEEKPASLAFHYRTANEAAAAAALKVIADGPAIWPGVQARFGKKVVELSVVETNKGMALKRLRQRVGATAVLFMGDDITDEDAFETLVGPDLGIKVGPGATRTAYRAGDTAEVARILARLAERRAEWLAGSHATPIEQHAMLSDQRTVALLDPDGRVVWLCLPRVDSSAAFAELLGGPIAGFFDVRPIPDTARPTQSYLGKTFILETRWPTCTVTNYLDCGGSRAYQRAGRSDLVRVLQGEGSVRITFAPRLDFGRVETRLRLSEEGVEVDGSLDPLVLRAPGLPWRIVEEGPHQSAVAEFDLTREPCVLELRYGTANIGPDPAQESARRARTEQFWRNWAGSLHLPSVAPDLVLRSALVIKALTYGPTGAIAAAATTSLPEYPGGIRNWDYRFCWPRDGAMAAAALVRLGVTGPAISLLDWVLGILDRLEPPALIAPVYTVTGAHLGPEAEIGGLSGYRGSRPVRIGNYAAQQIQLDVFGPLADLVALLAEHGAALSSEHWRMIVSMVYAVEHRWREPDHGIWEVRRPRQQHVHSKVMCWQTVDRALQVARYLGRRQPDWTALRDQIAADVFAHGWNAGVNAFCATYEDSEPDASTLWVGLSGMLAPDDPRFAGTIDYVARSLREGPIVYRYHYDDGLPGAEGGFHLCTAWLIESYVLTGRIDEAKQLFEQYIAQAGPTGLMSEEHDHDLGIALGNFPQAYSHLGLINAAVRLAPFT